MENLQNEYAALQITSNPTTNLNLETSATKRRNRRSKRKDKKSIALESSLQNNNEVIENSKEIPLNNVKQKKNIKKTLQFTHGSLPQNNLSLPSTSGRIIPIFPPIAPQKRFSVDGGSLRKGSRHQISSASQTNISNVNEEGREKLANYGEIPPHKIRKGKNIWRPPVKEAVKNIVFVDTQLLENETLPLNYNFDIKSVSNPSKGYFIRKRSKLCKYIRLETFSSNIPVIIYSNFKIRVADEVIEIFNMKTARKTLKEATTSGSSKELSSASIIQKESNLMKVGVKFKQKLAKTSEIANSSIDSKSPKKKSKTRRSSIRTKVNKLDHGDYDNYITENEVEEGLKDGTLIKGLLRINPRNSKHSYVTSIVKGDTDYLINSIVNRNRALDGDEVVLKVNPEQQWDDDRKTAIVVYISKMVCPRTTVGKLLPIPKNDNFAAFIPRDNKFPIINIPTMSWPVGFRTNPEKFDKNLFVAKITEWTRHECAKGLIIEHIGTSGELRVENLAILKIYGLAHEPFGNDVLKNLPKLDSLQSSWLVGREDLRKECIFSIDPLTARDLDDAMSCKALPDGNFEIGVHIADVSHYLKEGTVLDKQVGSKATTVYMVDNVYHMLPVELCMGCSLLPSKDKLSFSVLWTMTPEGEILSTRFAKTVMNSCAQLAYEHAQAIIDDPDKFDASKFPKICNGYTIADIKDVVLKLYHISKNLRGKRFANGALRIDQLKISFNLDPQSGLPISYYNQELKEANRLIEEFMLLANVSVAEKIIESFPDIAFLRCHQAPKENMMKELKEGLESVGIHVDIASAKTIQSSLVKYSSEDFLGKVRSVVLNHLFAKPMTRAQYFCSGVQEFDTSYKHYALNIPLYTHFTSPIRRYADIMVHRLLAASIGISEKPAWDPLFVEQVANTCNTFKYKAKKAQEDSTKLYLSLFITKHGPLVRQGAVVEVRERTFDIIILDTGEIVRVYLNDLNDVKYIVEQIPCLDLTPKSKENQRKYWRIKMFFQSPKKNQPATELMIELFTLVEVELKYCPKKKKLLAKLLRPKS